jgi:hypothetical protein
MAKRGWEAGWLDRAPWARPIRVVIEEEREQAQAAVRAVHIRASEAADAERELSRQESIEARKQEQQMLKAARGDVLAALVLATELIPSMREVVKIVAESLKPDPVTGKRAAIAPAVAMGLLTRHATLIQKAVGAAEAVIQLSRLERGASTVNLGVGIPDEQLSMEDAMQELEAIEEVLSGARSSTPAQSPAARALPPPSKRH